jgi:hypothetical protein
MEVVLYAPSAAVNTKFGGRFMFNSFLEFMQDCMQERIEQLRLVIAEDEEHKRVTREQGELFNKLGNTLTGDKRTCLYDLDGKNTVLSEIEDEFFYAQGFMDAIVMAIVLLGRV